MDERKFDPKRRALAGLAFDADPAAHRFDELLGKGEAEAGALDVCAGGVEPLERHEEPGHQFGGDAAAGVLDFDPQAVCDLCARDGDGAVLAVKLHGVREQIEQDLPQALRVGDHLAIELVR